VKIAIRIDVGYDCGKPKWSARPADAVLGGFVFGSAEKQTR